MYVCMYVCMYLCMYVCMVRGAASMILILRRYKVVRLGSSGIVPYSLECMPYLW